MMLSDRSLSYSRLKPLSSYSSDNSSQMSFRKDYSSSNTRRFGRMYGSPSLERLNSYDRPSNGLMSRQKSFHDLSNGLDLTSSGSLSSPIGHRNLSLQKMRTSAWRQSESTYGLKKGSIPIPRRAFNGLHVSFNDSYTSIKSASHSPTPPRYVESSQMLDRRDLLMGHLNASTTSPSMSRRTKHHIPNRSNLTGMKQHWNLNSSNTSGDAFRTRLRERPLLSKISPLILSRAKSPHISSGTSSPSPTRFNDNRTPERRDSSGIYRNRYVIKFREHNLGQTSSQRRSSITWDLPTNFTNAKTPEELPISEQSELNEDDKGIALITPISNFETQQKQLLTPDILNKTQNLRQIQKEIKNEEMKEELISYREILELTVLNAKSEQECNATHEATDIVLIQTLSDMPEPSGTTGVTELPLLPVEEKVMVQSKDRNIKALNSKTKSPKKKKVKKKEPLKDQVELEVNRNNNVKNETIPEESDERLVPKVESQICKDENENIVNGVNLNQTNLKDLMPKRIKFRAYTFDDFNLLKVLGRGSFGKVFLAELKDHNVCFAIKCLKKHSVIEDDDVESIMIERKVLAYGSTHPFICKLFCTFQTESYLCFAMEWCCGGDLMFHVQKDGKFSEDKTRFYASEILCAVQYMHKKGIIYRDLKLDNIMVDKEGHIRLVDFGMCQGRIYREEFLPSNFCGTPEYMAPEIIKGVQYNQSVDFWSFGVVIYEMVVGTSPFHGTDEDELLWNVCYEEVNYPRYLSENIKNLIVLLLNKTPEQRLGMPSCPAGDICSQPFFNSVEWKKVAKCQIKPPFVPELSSPYDVIYFDEYFTKEQANLTPVDQKIIGSMDQILFKGFSFTNHNMTD